MLIATTKHHQRMIEATESAEDRLRTLEQDLKTLANFAMLAASYGQNSVDLKGWGEMLSGLSESARRLKEQQWRVTAMLRTPLKDQAGYTSDDDYAPVTA